MTDKQTDRPDDYLTVCTCSLRVNNNSNNNNSSKIVVAVVVIVIVILMINIIIIIIIIINWIHYNRKSYLIIIYGIIEFFLWLSVL